MSLENFWLLFWFICVFIKSVVLLNFYEGGANHCIEFSSIDYIYAVCVSHTVIQQISRLMQLEFIL